MKTSDKGKIALVVSEGIVETPYLDSVGVWTVGVGVTKSAGDIDPAKNKGKVFSIPELMRMFDKVLPTYEAIVNRNVKVSLKQNEYDALVHFVYNVGEPNFKKSNLLRNLNAGNKQLAFDKGFHGWLKPPELKKRRDKERDIALKGNYGGTIAPLYTVNNKFKPVAKGMVDVAKELNKTSGSIPNQNIPSVPVDETIKQEQKKNWVTILIEAILSIFKKG